MKLMTEYCINMLSGSQVETGGVSLLIKASRSIAYSLDHLAVLPLISTLQL